MSFSPIWITIQRMLLSVLTFAMASIRCIGWLCLEPSIPMTLCRLYGDLLSGAMASRLNYSFDLGTLSHPSSQLVAQRKVVFLAHCCFVLVFIRPLKEQQSTFLTSPLPQLSM